VQETVAKTRVKLSLVCNRERESMVDEFIECPVA
jgi:hypothetical protein